MTIHKDWRLMDTAEKIAAVKKVYVSGYSSAQIASLIPGAGRNGIISIYHRKPDEFTDCPLPPKRANGSRKPRPRPSGWARRIVQPGSTIKAAFSPRRNASEPKPPKPVAEPVVKPEFRMISLLDLGRDECKWPVEGSGEHARFCGCAAHEPGKPYCAYHRQMSVPS
jgi:GcrA cell cycle regulator